MFSYVSVTYEGDYVFKKGKKGKMSYNSKPVSEQTRYDSF